MGVAAIICSHWIELGAMRSAFCWKVKSWIVDSLDYVWEVWGLSAELRHQGSRGKYSHGRPGDDIERPARRDYVHWRGGKT